MQTAPEPPAPRTRAPSAWCALPRSARILVAVTAAVEALSTAGFWDRIGVLGWVWVRPSAVPALLLIAVLGRRLLAGGRRWLPSCAVAGAVIAVQASRQLAVFGGARGLAGFAVAALQEEVVFRGVIPLAVWVLLERAGARRGLLQGATLAVTAALFAVQPNHLRQGPVLFFGFALLFCLCVRRPEALLPAALAHLAFNLLSYGALYGSTSPPLRAIVTMAVLGAFVVTAGVVTGRRTPDAATTCPAEGPAERSALSQWRPALAVA